MQHRYIMPMLTRYSCMSAMAGGGLLLSSPFDKPQLLT